MGIVIETPSGGSGSGGSSGAARPSLGELSIQKESVGLFIGNQAASTSMPLFLRSQPEGIKYFNGWEAGLTSLDSSNAERFESGYASNLFDHSYNCNSVKLTNDIAAVAYGNYTDINKVVYQSENGGMYQPWTYTYNNYSQPNYTRFSSDFILPLISKNFSQFSESNTDFSNVFILVEYDGYTTGGAYEIATRTLDRGSFELFTYQTNPGSNDQSGTFYFDSSLDLVFLKSKYSIDHYSSELATGMTGVRLSMDSVAIDRANLQAQADKYRAAHPGTDFTYGFVGIKKVSIIKYMPVVECGKVDLYTRKSGRITSEFALGKVQSVGHGLKNGDIIKISGARNTYGKDTVLNGLKYVQVNTTDIFSLYEDPDMGRKTDTAAGSPDANWICVGNVYNNYLPDGWELKKTVFSPTGRNGYCIKTANTNYVTYGQEKNTSLAAEFSECVSMYDLFVKDVGYIVDYQYAVLNETVTYDPFLSKVPVRAYPSSLDFLWAREDQYVSGCKFGCDIDLKLIDGTYYLLVGERGIDSHFMYLSTKTNILPANVPTGKAHLFTLAVDSNKNLTYTHQKTFTATSGDSTITEPDQISTNTNNYVSCYLTGTENATSLSYNVAAQQILLDKNVVGDGFLTNDYWFGAYLFHFDVLNSTSYNGDFPYRSAYFSNFGPPDLTFTNDGIVNKTLSSHDMYPYCDSFGKSVCLSNDSSGLIVIASSKNKIQLYPNNHIYTINNFATTRSHISCIPVPYNDVYSGVDCGYVHCITYAGSTVNKINKLSHPGVQTISGGIDPQYIRAESFAKTIRIYNGILYFGCSRAEEFYDTKYYTTADPNVPAAVHPINNPITINDYLYHSDATSTPVFNNEKSCIYSYAYSGTYSLLGKIESENSSNHYYQVQVLPFTTGRYIDYCPNQKPLTIQNKKYRNKRVYDHTSYEYGDVLFFPGDRFGDYFDINKYLLVTNSLDITNDRGILHTDIAAGPDRACDYIHVYENVSGAWKIVSKISATINSTDSRYSYESLYDNGSQCISSLRNLGNHNFSNTLSSSKTWDIDLANSYVVADDRLVLKDPFGYSVFRRQPGQLSSSGSSSSSSTPAIVTPVYPYFKFDERFSAIYNTGSFDQLCNFSHKKFGSLYEYNLNSYINNQYSPGGFDVEFLTPTYFFSLPNSYADYSSNKFVITMNVAETVGTGNLQLKLHSKDPRVNTTADYINNFTYGCSQDSSTYLYSDTDPVGENIFAKGTLSSEDSEVISATSVVDSGLDYKTYTFEIPLSKINQYLLFQNQLKNTTRTSNGESLVLNDSAKTTYNSAIEVINTMIVSFCFGNKSYSVPQFDQDKNYEIVSISANLVTPASTVTVFNQQTGSLYSSGVYSCIYNKVATYAYNTILNNCSSTERIYTNPVLGLGTSVSSAYSVYTPNDYTGDIADSYQMMAVDRYNSFDAPNKITGSDLVSVTSLDIQPIKYLSLYMSTASVTPSGQISLFTDSASTSNSNVTFSILASVGIENSANLFLGPSTYLGDSTLYIRAVKGVIEVGSGDSTGNLGLNIPYTTSLIGTQMDSGITLNLKTLDSGSQANLFVKGPTVASSSTNLYILPRSYALPNDTTLFANGSFIQSAASNLVVSGNSPGNLNLVLNGPTELNNFISLSMYSPTADVSGSVNLVSYETPYSEFPLYMRAPEIGTANTTLFTKYDLKYANSIDDTPSSSCEAYPNDVPFDITSVMAESLINGSNSISGPNYSTGEVFGYEPNQIPISQIDSDYKFYRYGRFQKVIDTNGSVLAVGIREGDRPKLLIFSLSGGQATLIEKKDPYAGLADSSQVFGDCLVLDVKVSTAGKVAFSSYVEIKNSFGQFVQGYFITYLYNSDATYLADWNRSFTDPSNDAFMANHMGMTLYWTEDESLIYTKEVGIVGTIQQRIAPNYDVEEFLFSADQMNDYAATYNHWLTGKMPFYRMAFGHRIQKFGDSLFVTTPLFDGFASINQLDSFRYPKFSGNISTFQGQGQDLWYNHTINEDTLFGYDMFVVDYYGEIGISSARDNSIWNTDISISGFNQNSSSDLDFGISIDNCDRAIYSVLGSALYNLNGKSFSYSGIDDEIAPYIPSGNAILSKQEKIRGSVIAGGYHFVFREFDVTYGFGTRAKFNKISLIKQSKKYETPTLFIQNYGLDSGIPLTLETIKVKDSSINMSTGGVYAGQDGCSLFIRQIPDGGMDNALPLKLQGNDPVGWADQVGLALYGTFTSDTFSLSSSENTLFIGSDNSFTDNVPLKIQGPDSASLDNAILLFMNIVQPSTVWQNTTSPSLGINIVNAQTVEQNWQVKNGGSTLYLNSTYGVGGNVPLWIVRKGPGGGEELEASSNLTINNKDVASGVSLYTNAIYGIGNNVSLVFTPSAGNKDKDMKIQIFGYKE